MSTFTEKLKLAATVIKFAGDLGLPLDVLGGVFGEEESETEKRLLQIEEALDVLQDTVTSGFFNALQIDALGKVQESLEKSRFAFLDIDSVSASDSQKEDALTAAREGLSNVAGAITAVTSLVESGDVALTPVLVQEMYAAVAFSLWVQISAKSELSWGGNLNGKYQHGGFLTVEPFISAGVDALKLLETTITNTYGTIGVVRTFDAGRTDVNDPFFDAGATASGTPLSQFGFTIDHNIFTVAEARVFYQKLLSEVLPVNERDFSPENFKVTETQVFYKLPGNIVPTALLPLPALVETTQDYLDEIGRVIGQLALHELTGEKVGWDAEQKFLYTWNQIDQFDAFDDLIASVEATIDGIVVEHFGDEGAVLNGTEGGDHLIGAFGDDRLFGNGDDDYLQGGAGNDLVFGGEGSDRYFSKAGFFDTKTQQYTLFGQDGFLDNGAESDVDVLVLEGNRGDYTFYDDTGTTGPRIKIVKAGDPDSDLIRGIEILKFDDGELEVSKLTLLPRDFVAPDAPVIGGVSDGDGVVVFGTAEANSFVTVTTGAGGTEQTQTDDSGVWSFDFGATTGLENGSYTFTAFASDAVNNNSDTSAGLTVTIDKVVPLNEIDGDSLNNLLLGTAGRDLMRGFEGNDELRGFGGNDIQKGGKGDDDLFGGKGKDKLFGGGGGDKIDGGGSKDRLFGGGGNDILSGGAKNDIVYGGKGKDIMTGGKGADDFVFNDGDTKNAPLKRDVITDFDPGNDDIDLRLIDADLSLAGDQQFDFAEQTEAANSVWFKVSGDNVIVMGDNTGDGVADFRIKLLDVGGLSADDFLL